MRDVLGLLAALCIYAWGIPANILTVRRWRSNRVLLRWFRLACPLALPSWTVLVILDPPKGWYLWLPVVAFPFIWRSVHREFCKDKHGRRWLEKARGFVQRRGNRLVIAPVVTR